MSQTPSPFTGKRYGVRRVCALWRIPRSSYHAWSKRREDTVTETPVPAKPKPKTALGDEEIVETIREIIARREADDGIRGEGYRKIRVQLAARGYRVGFVHHLYGLYCAWSPPSVIPSTTPSRTSRMTRGWTWAVPLSMVPLPSRAQMVRSRPARRRRLWPSSVSGCSISCKKLGTVTAIDYGVWRSILK